MTPLKPRHISRGWSLTLFTLLLFHLPLLAQSPLNAGFKVFSRVGALQPQATDGPTITTTEASTGLTLVAGAGGYMDVNILPGLAIRGGIDVSYQRSRYDVERTSRETGVVRSGYNQVRLTRFEVPLSLVYWQSLNGRDRNLLLGLEATALRLHGNPRVSTRFRGSEEDVEFATHTVTAFAGYEHPISRLFTVSIEPQITYAPTRLHFERGAVTRSLFEAGIALRVRIDN